MMVYIDGSIADISEIMSITVLPAPAVTVTDLGADAGLLVSWPAAAGAESYQVYRLTEENSVFLGETTDVSWVDQDGEYDSVYYQVYACAGDSVSAASGINVKNTSAGVQVIWEAVSGATSYMVYYKMGDDDFYYFNSASAGEEDFQSKTISSDSGVSYTVYVTALKDGSYLSKTDSAVITYLSAPDVTLTDSDTGIELSWVEVSGAESYNVYRRTDTAEYQLLGTTADAYWSDADINAGEIYTYCVYACCSDYASTGTEVNSLGVPEVTLDNTREGILLSWAAVSGAENYYIYRKTAGEDDYTLVDTVTDTAWTDTDALTGTTYSYQVCACAGETVGAASAEQSITSTGGLKLLSANNVSDGIKVTWQTLADADTYYAFYRESTNTSISYYSEVSAEESDTQSITFSYLSEGTSYDFYVTALSDGTKLATTETMSVTVLSAPSLSLTGFGPGTGTRVSWPAVTGAESYQIYRLTDDGSQTLLGETDEIFWLDSDSECGSADYQVYACAGDSISAASALTVRNTADGVRVIWGTREEADSYLIYYKTDDSDTYSYASVSAEDGETQSMTISIDSSGASYTIYVLARKDGSYLSKTGNAVITYLSAPGVTLTENDTGIELSWEEISGAENYNVYRRTETEEYQLLGTTADACWSDTEIDGDEIYTYCITSCCSEYASAGFEVNTLGMPEVTLENSDSVIRLSWTEVAGAENYLIYRKVEGEDDYILVDTVTDTTWTDTDVSTGVTYSYQVCVCIDGMLGTASFEQSIICTGGLKLLSVSNVSDGIQVTWSTLADADRYRIYYTKSGGSGSAYSSLSAEESETQSKTVSSRFLTEGACYEFYVAAMADDSILVTSDTMSIIVLSASALLITNPGPDLGTRVSWETVTGAEYYRIYRLEEDGSQTLLGETEEAFWLDSDAECGLSFYQVYACAADSVGAASELSIQNTVDGVSVTWKTQDEATSYRVYYKADDADTYSYYSKSAEDRVTQSKTISLISSGESYEFYVSALKSGSYLSETRSAVITYLSAPEVEVAGDSSEMELSWEEIAGAEGYRIYRKSADGNYELLGTTLETFWLDTEVENAASYIYRVYSYCGEYASEAVEVEGTTGGMTETEDTTGGMTETEDTTGGTTETEDTTGGTTETEGTTGGTTETEGATGGTTGETTETEGTTGGTTGETTETEGTTGGTTGGTTETEGTAGGTTGETTETEGMTGGTTGGTTETEGTTGDTAGGTTGSTAGGTSADTTGGAASGTSEGETGSGSSSDSENGAGSGTGSGTTMEASQTASAATVGSSWSNGGVSYTVTASGESGGTVSVKAPESTSATSVTIPATVTIDGAAYSVTTIEEGAFSGCTNLKSVTIGSNVTTIGKNAFYKCTSLTSVSGGASLVSIGASAFFGCKALKKITLSSKSLTTIGASAFQGCTALKSFTAKSTKLKTIGKKAFYGDKKLATVTLKTTKLTKASVKASAFKGIKKTCTFKVPSKKMSAYKKIFKARGAGSKIKVKKV